MLRKLRTTTLVAAVAVFLASSAVMADGILTPAKNSGPVKPYGMPKINWNDPRTKGLVGAWVFDGTTPINLVTGERATLVGTPIGQSTQIGQSSYFNNQTSGASYYVLHNGPLIGGLAAWSIISGIIQTSGSSQPSDGGVNYGERASSGNDIIKLGLAGNDAPGVGNYIYRNDAGTIINQEGGTTVKDGLPHVLAVTKNGAGSNNFLCYIDSKLVATTSWNSNDNFTNAVKATVGGDPGDSASFVSGNVPFTYIFNEAVSPATVASISRNPYGFLIYPKNQVVGTMEAIFNAITNSLLLAQ